MKSWWECCTPGQNCRCLAHTHTSVLGAYGIGGKLQATVLLSYLGVICGADMTTSNQAYAQAKMLAAFSLTIGKDKHWCSQSMSFAGVSSHANKPACKIVWKRNSGNCTFNLLLFFFCLSLLIFDQILLIFMSILEQVVILSILISIYWIGRFKTSLIFIWLKRIAHSWKSLFGTFLCCG